MNRLIRRHLCTLPSRLAAPPPDHRLDWNYLTDGANLAAIRDNIRRRRSPADIDAVHRLYDQWRRDGTDSTREQLVAEALRVPNQTHPDVGDSPVVVGTIGDKPDFSSFEAFPFDRIVDYLDLVRTRNFGLLANSRTYTLKRELAQMERALVRYTMSRLVRAGFEPVSVPDMVSADVIDACGFSTTGARTQVYKLAGDGPSMCLSGTAEMAMAGLLRGRRLGRLPLRLVAASRCYRAEVSGLRAEAGIYRVHNFTKVEMFGVAEPSGGEELVDEFVGLQRRLFGDLGLHCQVLLMPADELGNPAYKKIDIEAYLPSRGTFGEISSASNCTDYQSRRLGITTADGGFADTVNGTACAVPRTIMAVVEANQTRQGTLTIPPVLRPYFGGRDSIRKIKAKDALNYEWNKTGKAMT